MIKSLAGWLYFAVVQVVALLAAIVGLLLLITPCVKRAWLPVTQIYIPTWQKELGIPAKTIYLWRWWWLNRIWGNDEDGVVSGLRNHVEYNPERSRLKAYLWCAWRNSANNLRFVFRWKHGPYVRREWSQAVPKFHRAWSFITFEKVPWYVQIGWNDSGFPVLSAGKIDGKAN